jgi:hypothetical protein
MQREIIRVEPIDSNFEKWGAPVSTCTRAGNMVFVSGMPPFLRPARSSSTPRSSRSSLHRDFMRRRLRRRKGG